ncbi:methyltransferase domain-containing protein [Christiangramia aquimixticola]|uniref:methyltransferase domain-containing protein n=1 Tax=Christiangramia aquimixticola TaxID=1697558 RepID=UPI003AA9782B
MNKDFWANRYHQNKTGWDIGYVSIPLKEYIDKLSDKNLKILIPGAGNAYEAEYLFEHGFKNTYICDIAAPPLKNFKQRNPEFPEDQIIQADFFELDLEFDLILEQTFFCAIPVDKRSDYAKKTHELLKPKATLAGLLFNFPLSADGPPFGGSRDEYLTYFSPYFEIEILETAYNSIKPRQGNELFFKFRKK